MPVVTMEDIIENNRLRKEKFEAIKNQLKDNFSQEQLDELEKVFMFETRNYFF